MGSIFVRQFYFFATLVSGKHCKTTISRNFRSTVLRFCNIKTIFVRQFYVFATLISGKHCKTTISRNVRSTVPRCCNIKTIFVRQFYVFGTLMSGKHCKTTISVKFSFDSSTFLQHQDTFRSTLLRFWNTDVRKTKQNNDSKAKMRQFYVFITKMAPRLFLSDSSIF